MQKTNISYLDFTWNPGCGCKIYHKANLISPDGSVSPLCAKKPRKLNLARECWTTTDEFVTCKRCKRLIDNQGRIDG